MQRYFFDRISSASKELDYRGCDLATVEHAVELAELIALDLAIDATSKWAGWTIRVSDAVGRHILTIPVQELDAI